MSNYAGRLLELMEKISREGDVKEPAAKVWPKVLGLDDTREDSDFEVARRLSYLDQQVRQLRQLLIERGSARLPRLDPHLKRVQAAVSLRNLGASWQSVRDQAKVDTIASLLSMAEWMPDDDWPDDSELATILAEVDALQERVRGANLPDAAAKFLGEQLQSVRRAVEESRYRGPDALLEASDRAAQEWLTTDVTRGLEDTAVVQEVRSVWPKVARMAKRALVLGEFARFVFLDLPELANRAQTLLELAAPTHHTQQHLPAPKESMLPPDLRVKIEDEDTAGSSPDRRAE